MRGDEIPINGVEVARAWMRARRARAVDINGQTLVRAAPAGILASIEFLLGLKFGANFMSEFLMQSKFKFFSKIPKFAKANFLVLFW